MDRKKLIGLGVAAFVAICAVNSLLALHKALEEKKRLEAEQEAQA